MKATCKIFAALLVSSAWLPAQDAQIEQKFKDELENKVFLLRDFASDKEIQVKADGTLQQAVHRGIWPLAYMEVAHVTTEKKKVLLEGPRVGLRYDEAKKKLVSIRTKEDVAISVSGAFNGSPDEIVQRVKDAVFMPEGSQLGLLPDYWREYYEGSQLVERLGFPTGPSMAPPLSVAIDGEQWFRCSGGGLKPPKAQLSPSPEYNDVARKLKFQGRNIFVLLISKSGLVDRVLVSRPLGLGLDENSINTLKTWKFNPGTKDGQPVNCVVNVETNFNLY